MYANTYFLHASLMICQLGTCILCPDETSKASMQMQIVMDISSSLQPNLYHWMRPYIIVIHFVTQMNHDGLSAYI